MSVTASPLGSMKTTPRPASASARICPAISVVLPVPVGPQIRRWWRASGTARPTGRGAPASETPRGRTPGPGSGMAGGGGTARAPARASPGQRRVGGQPGDRRQFRHGQQVALGQPAGADRGGGVAKASAGQPVPPGEQGGGRGEGVGQAAQPGRLLRGGGPPLPAACAVAGLDRGGGSDRVADKGFPLRPGELGGGLADLGGQVGVGAAGGPGAAGSVPGAGQVQQPGGDPGGLPGTLLAGGAAGLAEPGAGDRPGEDLQDGVLAVGEAGRGPGQRPQRRLGVMAGGQRQDVRAGQPQRPAGRDGFGRQRRPGGGGDGVRAGPGGFDGALDQAGREGAGHPQADAHPGGVAAGPGVLPAQVRLPVPPACPGGAQQPGQVPPQRRRAGRAGLRRGQDGDLPGGLGEGRVLPPAQPGPACEGGGHRDGEQRPGDRAVMLQGGEQQPGQVRGVAAGVGEVAAGRAAGRGR